VEGHSANYMADVCRREGLKTKIVCVDTFNGSEEHWSYPPLREQLFLKNGRPTILERFMAIRRSGKHGPPSFPYRWTEPARRPCSAPMAPRPT
jgi:hypothetical protein